MAVSFEKLSESIVHYDEECYTSFPHVIEAQGELLCVFRKASSFSRDSAIAGVATHHDLNSSIWLSRSSDSGVSWSRPSLVYDGPYGVNDPTLTLLASGHLLVRFVLLEVDKTSAFLYDGKKIFSHRAEHGLVTRVKGNLVLRAEGPTYDRWEYVSVSDNFEIGPSCSRDPIIQLADESLLMPVYTGAPQRSDQSWCLRSFDDGRNWVHPILIAEDPAGASSQMRGINFNETSLLDRGNGSILAMVRGDSTFHTDSGFMPVGGVGKLYVVSSDDSGMSWGPARDTGIFGQPGALTSLSDGRILATYGVRRSPYGVRCSISEDEGLTWGDEICLYDSSPSWDCGYPFTVVMEDQALCTLFYCPDATGIRHIKSMVWRINESS